MTYKYNPFWQQRIRETVRHALNVHPRLTALRVDLRFPDVPAATDAAVISRFINALKARIDAYQKRKHREGKRVHPTTLHYVWAREFGECKGKKHYHLMLLVNRDTWCRAGDYRAPGSLAGMIKQAWCSALGVDVGCFPCRFGEYANQTAGGDDEPTLRSSRTYVQIRPVFAFF